MAANSHKDLSAKLLRDAAAFFGTIGEQNPPLAEQMRQNADVFRQVADLVEKDPVAEVAGGQQAFRLGEKLLKDAAAFFETISAQNPPLQEQMKENASVFRQVARLLEEDPLGVLEEQAPTATLVELRDPLAHAEQRASSGSVRIDPEFGLSFPCAGNRSPMHVLRDTVGESALRAAANARDDYTCRHCGFRCQKYQAAAGPIGAFTVSQLHTCCMFCAQVANLDRVASAKSGRLVWLPEIGQAELNAWMRVIYICRIGQERSEEARALLDALGGWGDVAKRRFGSDDPAELAQRLGASASPREYRQVLDEARGLRLLPLDRRIVRDGDLEYNQFPQILAYWRSMDGPFGNLAPRFMDLAPLHAVVDGMGAAA